MIRKQLLRWRNFEKYTKERNNKFFKLSAKKGEIGLKIEKEGLKKEKEEKEGFGGKRWISGVWFQEFYKVERRGKSRGWQKLENKWIKTLSLTKTFFFTQNHQKTAQTHYKNHTKSRSPPIWGRQFPRRNFPFKILPKSHENSK